MNIVEAASADSVKNAALAYAKLGFSVLPLHGKQPPMTPTGPLSWNRRKVERASESMITTWARAGYLQNVGIVCGAVSGNLVVIDLDSEEAVHEFYGEFANWTRTYTVATGRGRHLYYRCDTLPPTTRTRGFEVRAEGCYVVAPPSKHPGTGRPYRVQFYPPVEMIQRVVNLAVIQRWVEDKNKVQSPVFERPPERPLNRTIGFGYGGRALASECRIISSAPDGSRNNLLNRAAYNMGQLVADGVLTRGEVESALLGAAMACGLDEVSSARTIKSGLDAGMLKPRSQMFRVRGTR